MHRNLAILGLSPLLSFAGVAAQEPAPKAPPAAANQPVFKLLRTFAVGGDGTWDYLTVDAAARRLYVPRMNHVQVLDADSGKQVGDIGDVDGVKDVVIVPELGKGFTSADKTNVLAVFDLKTLAVGKPTVIGKRPIAAAFEPVTKSVCIADHKSNDVWLLSAAQQSVAGTVAVGGQPESMAADGRGKLFVTVQDTAEVVCIDVPLRKVTQRLALAPNKKPTGLAFDPERRLLFAACGNDKLVVLEADSGKILASPAIGKKTDSVAFDAEGGWVLAAGGDGTLAVIGTRGDAPFTPVQTVPTAAGSRTMAFDGKAHCAYVPAADFEPEPANLPPGTKYKPVMKAGTFRILVIGR